MNIYPLNNNGISLECLDNLGTEGVPLVVVPGMSESVHDWIDFAQYMLPTPVHVISLRGRGNSDAPLRGYALNVHVGDIASLIRHNDFKNFNLMGYSRGSSYALGTLERFGERINALILGDYPARHSRLPGGFVENFAESTWRGKDVSQRMPLHAIAALQNDSHSEDLLGRLEGFSEPVLLLAGNEKLGALLDPEEIDRISTMIPHVRVRRLQHSGHDIFRPKPITVHSLIKDFVEGCGP